MIRHRRVGGYRPSVAIHFGRHSAFSLASQAECGPCETSPHLVRFSNFIAREGETFSRDTARFGSKGCAGEDGERSAADERARRLTLMLSLRSFRARVFHVFRR